MAGQLEPQDGASGLVERRWERKSSWAGALTERTLEGEHVEATFVDRHGHVQHAAGIVRRNHAGELVVESWAENVRKQTPVTRDANVDVRARPR